MTRNHPDTSAPTREDPGANPPRLTKYEAMEIRDLQEIHHYLENAVTNLDEAAAALKEHEAHDQAGRAASLLDDVEDLMTDVSERIDQVHAGAWSQ